MAESYLKSAGTLVQHVQEALTLYRFHSENLSTQVTEHLRSMKEHQESIEQLIGEPLRDKRILEIGPGQLLKQARFFGGANQVVGLDLDEVITGWNPLAWLRMLRRNGPVRFSKTVARKALGIDRRFAGEVKRQMPELNGRPRIKLYQRDATETGFNDGSFDCAVSFSVLEHIPDPRRLLRELARVLRPGGVSYHLVHIYTSDSGAHDPRTFAAEHPAVPYWCHLRSHVEHLSAPNAYVNKVRLREWREIAEAEHPNCEFRTFTSDEHSPLAAELKTLRAAGELGDYDDDELLNGSVIIAWRKPAQAGHD